MSATDTTPSNEDLADRLKFIVKAANESARLILPYFRGNISIDHKDGQGRFDPVTEADRAGEKIIRKLINTHYPEDGIFGEEFGKQEGTSPYCWVLDPIDGTRSFISGIPLWGTLIGLTYQSRAIAGAMNQPYTEELFLGAPEGTYLFKGGQKTRLKTRHCSNIKDALAGSTAPEIFTATSDIEAFDRIKKAVRLIRFGGDCYLYCMVAAGQLDLVVETGLNAYDIAALVPIIENAGGIITTWEGTPAAQGGRIIAAGCREIHDAALDLLNA